jgi:DNA-binding NtrC family response regulator
MANLLIVGKKSRIQAIVKRRFAGDQVSVDAVRSSEDVLEKFRQRPFDILIWDVSVNSDKPEGLKMVRDLSEEFPMTQIIVISDHEDPELRFNGAKAVSFPSLERPTDIEHLCALIRVALQKQPEATDGQLDRHFNVPVEFESMLGISLPMREVFQRVIEAASADISVLITGETGTGKDLVASAIHKRSKRKDKPYISVHTGAMPSELIATELFGREKGAYTGAFEASQGRFEQADGGTIFLDEISTMDEKAQISLLRVLESRTFRRVGGEEDVQIDVRVIAATNEDLEEACKARRFREDLYYRLDVFHINLPPLRQRLGAITILTDEFLLRFNAVYRKNVRIISPEAMRLLRRYSWPGNVRELKNVIQRAVLMAKGEEITPDLIPARIRESADAPRELFMQTPSIHAGMTLGGVEKEFITMTLNSTRGNKKAAAQRLGISRRALYNKLKKHGLI